MRPFLVRSIGAATGLLSSISGLQLVERNIARFAPNQFAALDKQTRAALAEIWVTANFAVAILLLISTSGFVDAPARSAAILYACIRLSELINFQIFTQVFGGYPGKLRPRLRYDVVSWRRSIFMALLLYFEVLVWFAFLYRANCRIFGAHAPVMDRPIYALYFSAVTLLTIGYGDFAPKTQLGFIMVITEGCVGLAMTVLILSRIIGYLPTPDTIDPDELAEDDDLNG